MNSKYCTKCQKETKCEIVFKKSYPKIVEYFSKNSDGVVNDKFYRIHVLLYEISECKGCEEPTVHITEYCPEKDNPELLQKILSGLPDDSIKHISTFCFPNENYPEWVKSLDTEIMKVYFETFSLKTKKMYRFTAMGLRLIFDIISTKKVGDIGGFDKKLKKLFDENFISKSQYDSLKILIDAGNAATHRYFEPTEEVIETCFMILDNLLKQDLITYSSEFIKNKIPKRN